MTKRCLCFALLIVACRISAPVSAPAAEADRTEIPCREVRLLGPLPGDPGAPAEQGVLRGEQKLVPEITPDRRLPRACENGWRTVQAGADGRFKVAEPGVYWIAARLRTAARAEADFSLGQGSALYVQDEKLSVRDPGAAADTLTASRTLTRGWVTVTGRLILDDGDTGFFLNAAADADAQAAWTLAPRVAVTRFGDTDEVTSISSLAVSDGDPLVARYLTRRSDDVNRLDILDGKGRMVAADLGGGKMRPVGFLPHSRMLLLRRGKDLVRYDVDRGEERVLLEDEPGLGFVRIAPGGGALLFSSRAGFDSDEPVDGPGRRYTRFRERISDYTPAGHLHLLDLESGVRRILTRPGDFVLDDAVFAADGKAVIYGRTLPQAARPWFTSEIRRLDLATGRDTLITAFTSGWEVRPQAFAVSPDGKRLAFIGPPQEIGPDRDDPPQHNVYNKQVWLLDLDSGRYRRITTADTFAWDGGGGFPRFAGDHRLLARITDGAANRLARLDEQDGRWRATALPRQGASMGAVALSPDGRRTAYTASDPDHPAALYLAAVGKAGRLLEEPGAELLERTLWAPVAWRTDDPVEAWYFPPLTMGADGGAAYAAPDTGRAPLIVYYYGGSVPTMRSFNTTFQFFAANGYGVLAVNPRGAAGYGETFADHHAGDWGPAAAADVMEATRRVLAEIPYLDPARVGIYGGSYGGFMTDYLVTHTDMYAAAVSMYGISDLVTYFGQGAWGVTYGDMALGGRNPWDDPRYFVEHSPVYHADKVTTPLLLLHGLADGNVTTGESIQLFTELSVLDKPVEMVLFPGEDHGISGSWKNRVAHRTMMLEWFDRWLKDRPEAWEDRWR